jgi:hypothetical protein
MKTKYRKDPSLFIFVGIALIATKIEKKVDFPAHPLQNSPASSFSFQFARIPA